MKIFVKRNLIKCAIIFNALAFSGHTYSALISDPSQLDPASIIIDFESISVGTSEPIVINGVTITDDNTSVTSSIQPQDWTQYPGIFEGQFFGLGVGDRGFVVEFETPVSQFGMGVFDPNFTGNILRALDSNGNVLEQMISNTDPEFPVGPTGGIFSTFVGFSRNQRDIQRIELINVPGDWLAIDTITYSTVVPLPASIYLLASGLLSILGFTRFKANNA